MVPTLEQALEPIVLWLEAGAAADYRAGVLLLQDRSGLRGLVNNLLKKDSPGNREKLTYELLKVLTGGRVGEIEEVASHFAQAVHTAVPTPVVEVPSVPVAPQVVVPTELTPTGHSQLEQVTQQLSKLYNQRCQLSNSLADLDPAEGPRVVGEIIATEKQYNALAETKRRLEAGEVLPEEAPAEQADPAAPTAPVDRAALLQQRANLRSNISKSKGKAVNSKTAEKRSEHAQKAAQWEVELQVLETQLALPQ